MKEGMFFQLYLKEFLKAVVVSRAWRVGKPNRITGLLHAKLEAKD